MTNDPQSTNHLQPDGQADLPELLEDVWTREKILTLFEELHAGTEVSHVQLRERTVEGLRDHTTTLAQAKQSFESGSAQAIQIRYRFAGETWCDTLMPQGLATRIIRTRMEN